MSIHTYFYTNYIGIFVSLKKSRINWLILWMPGRHKHNICICMYVYMKYIQTKCIIYFHFVLSFWFSLSCEYFHMFQVRLTSVFEPALLKELTREFWFHTWTQMHRFIVVSLRYLLYNIIIILAFNASDNF